MTATLTQTQAELPRLVDLASRGEEVVITVDGKPRAKLTRADGVSSAPPGSMPDIAAWLKDLEDLRRKYTTGKNGPSTEQLLEEDRADRL